MKRDLRFIQQLIVYCLGPRSRAGQGRLAREAGKVAEGNKRLCIESKWSNAANVAFMDVTHWPVEQTQNVSPSSF